MTSTITKTKLEVVLVSSARWQGELINRYQAIGTMAQLIEAGLATEDWFPQGRKRVASGATKGNPGSWWTLRKGRGDVFTLNVQKPSAAQQTNFERALPPNARPAATTADDALTAVTGEDGFRDVCLNGLKMTWRLVADQTAKSAFPYRLAKRDAERVLVALRDAHAILKHATVVSLADEATAMASAKEDAAFQAFMTNQGFRSEVSHG